MNIYTKTGDDGSTGLYGSGRVRKDIPRIEAYGDVDETNAAIGAAISFLQPSSNAARGWLDAIQSDLFVIGAALSTAPNTPSPSTLSPDRITSLEKTIDQMESELTPIKNFILPQGSSAAALLHLSRTIARRAERRIVTLAASETVDSTILIYINRLSDFLFVLARWVNHREGGMETTWVNTPSGPTTTATQTSSPAGQDRLSVSLKKLDEDKERRKSLFEQTAADLQRKKEKAQQLFSQGVEKIKKDGGKVDPAIRPIDLD